MESKRGHRANQKKVEFHWPEEWTEWTTGTNAKPAQGTKKGLTGQGADGSPGDQAAYYEQQVKIENLESWGNQKSSKELKAMGPKAGGETASVISKYYNKC